MSELKKIMLAGLICMGMSNMAQAQIIDFESQGDQELTSNQYLSTHGVTFSIRDPGTSTPPSNPRWNYASDARTARVGGLGTAFVGPTIDFPSCNVTAATNMDMPNTTAQLITDCVFLTDDLTGRGVPTTALFVEYSSPVSGASGYILDTDNSEAWLVEGYSQTNPTFSDAPVATYKICGPTYVGTGCDVTVLEDGAATEWVLSLPCNGPTIRSISIDYVGSPGVRHVGLAFDKFTTNSNSCTGDLQLCCAPWGPTQMPSMKRESGGGPYRVWFEPNTIIDTQMQSFVNLAKSYDPTVESGGVLFWALDCIEDDPVTAPCGPTSTMLGDYKTITWEPFGTTPIYQNIPSSTLTPTTISGATSVDFSTPDFVKNRLYYIGSLAYIRYLDGSYKIFGFWGDYSDCPGAAYKVNHTDRFESMRQRPQISPLSVRELESSRIGAKIIKDLKKLQANQPTPSSTKWSRWLNTDRPGGNGDYQTLKSFVKKGQVCSAPADIECRRVSDKKPASRTGEVVTCKPKIGATCVNSQQKDKRCDDYEVRFLCPEK